MNHWNRLTAIFALAVMIASFGLMSSGMGGGGGITTKEMEVRGGTRWGNTGVRHFTVQDTAAAAHVLPKNGIHLVRVTVFGGAHAGSLIVNYAANKFAHFPVSLSGQADYDVDWTITGSNLASGIFTTDGTAPISWTLTFSESSWGGPSIEQYLAIRAAVTAGGAVSSITAMSSVNFDAGESIPVGVMAYVAAAGVPAAVYFPGEPGFQGGANAQNETITFQPPLVPAPVVKAANAIVMGYTAGAAGLVTAYVFYATTAKR